IRSSMVNRVARIGAKAIMASSASRDRKATSVAGIGVGITAIDIAWARSVRMEAGVALKAASTRARAGVADMAVDRIAAAVADTEGTSMAGKQAASAPANASKAFLHGVVQGIARRKPRLPSAARIAGEA